jgi:dienelactone hydrolase
MRTPYGVAGFARISATITALSFGAAVQAAPAVGQVEERWQSDEWLDQPVDDATFETYLEFFAYDADLPFELEVLSVSNEEGLRVEHIAFQSTPGETVYANYYTASTSAPGTRPYVIAVHGGIPTGKEYLTPVAERFVRSGFDVITIDLPYFGERDTGLLKSFSETDKHEALYNQKSTYLEWVVQLVKDVGRTFDLLVDHYGADPERIAYFGRSRGAQVGFIAVAVEQRFAASALAYGGHFDRSETGHLAAACPANYIGRIAPRPLWILNGTLDGDYDRTLSVEPLVRHAGEPSEMNWVDTGHVNVRSEDLDRIVAWYGEVLP